MQARHTFQCHQLYQQGMMHIIPADHNFSLVVRPRQGQAHKAEEDFEFDHRKYRYLLSMFAENLNQSMKQHRDCLGEMEYHPKYKVSKEEQEDYETSLSDIFQRYTSKLLKETVYRNTLIKKSRQIYQAQYEKAYPNYVETEPNASPNKRTTPSTGLLRKMTLNDGRKNTSLSVKSQSRKTVSTGSVQDKLLLLSQTFQAFQANISMTLKLKTISSSSENQNPETNASFLKTTRSSISRNQRLRLKSDQFPQRKKSKLSQAHEEESLLFKGNQILISDYRKESNEWQSQKEVSFHSKFCSRRVVAIGQPQKKAINDIEMLHMQARNIDNSNVFWPVGETYNRPKLKRWQHSFS